MAALIAATGATSGSGLHSVALTLIIVLLLTGAILLALTLNEARHRQMCEHRALREQLGLPQGKIVYRDADGTGQPLVARSYPLTGKPDYVVLAPNGEPIPVEVKPSVVADKPYPNHVLQMGAYLLLLEDLYPKPPTHGLLHYAETEFVIEHTDALKRKVLKRLGEMEAAWTSGKPPKLTRQIAAKCRSCAFQPVCDVGGKTFRG
jgi:CRISPR-associated exonuclease Cas4